MKTQGADGQKIMTPDSHIHCDLNYKMHGTKGELQTKVVLITGTKFIG